MKTQLHTLFRPTLLALSIVLAFGALDVTAATRPVTVRLGTVALRDTDPYNLLQEMGQKWREATNGRVRLNVFAATLGGESNMISLMRQGQLQAGLFTVTGLVDIDESVSGLQNIPMAYRSLDEAAFIREQLAARYEQQMEAKGFIVLGWCDYGWWQIFSREPMRVPADLNGQKMVVAAAGSPLAKIANSIRVQPVELEPSDFLVSLQTGLVTMVPVPPFFALAGQLYQPAKYMLEIDWAPVAGGIVLTKRTWEQLTPEQQTAVRTAAEEACEKITAQGRATMNQSIETMKRNGLVVQTLEGDLEKQWRDYFEAIYPEIRGNLVPEQEYDDIMSLLDEYRAQHSGSAS